MSTSDERGYSLTELAVVMSIFLIFMAMATPFMFNQLRAAIRTESRVDVQQEARSALRTLVRELRQAKELYSSTDKPSGKNSLSFGVDLDGDGTINSYTDSTKSLEQITYFISQGTLYRGRKSSPSHGQPLAEGVTQMVFTIYGSNLTLDANGDGTVTENELDTNANAVWDTTELANVTRVGVSLTVADGGEQQTYGAQIYLRNRAVG